MTHDQAITFLLGQQKATGVTPSESRKFSETINLLKAARDGGMTVQEVGRKGGRTVREERGHEFYEEIGRKGGAKVRELIAAGKRSLNSR